MSLYKIVSTVVAIATEPNGQAYTTICSDATHANAAPQNYSTEQLLGGSQHFPAMATAAVQEYSSMIKNLVNQFAIANSGGGCSEIDTDGNSKWYRQQFSSLPPLTTDAGASEVVMRNDSCTYMQTYKKFTCAYNEYASQDCRLDAQAITSNTVTDTHTQTYSYQERVGFVAKVKGGGYVVTSVVYATLTTMVDSGLKAPGSKRLTFRILRAQASPSPSSAARRVRVAYLFFGKHHIVRTAIASVTVPMSPSDPRCVVIEVILKRERQHGDWTAWVRSKGFVGTKQGATVPWKYLDEPMRPVDMMKPQYRAFDWAWLVNSAKKHNVTGADAFTVKDDGYVYALTLFRGEFNVANTGYANPAMYPRGSRDCQGW